MKKMKLRRRILSILLAVCMMIPYMSIESYATMDNGEPSKEGTECCCTEQCTEDNITNPECAVCKENFSACIVEDKAVVDEEEPANGEEHIHNTDGEVSYEKKDATYHIKKVVCKDCPDSYVSESDEVHSTAEEGDRIPNCTSKGYCTVCRSEYGEVDPEAHNVVDGQCTNCDYVVETVPSDNGTGDEVGGNEGADNSVSDNNIIDNGINSVADDGVMECNHIDEDRNGICNTCGDTVAYKIATKSWLLGSENVSVAHISMNPSDGYVEVGKSVEVTVPKNMYGYIFKGWYLFSGISIEEITDELIQGNTVANENISFTYQPNEDVVLVAVYASEGKTGEVTLKGSDFTVSVKNGEETTVSGKDTYSKPHSFGTEITIRVSEENAGFIDWRNEYNKIVTTEDTYTFTVTGDVNLTMSKNEINGKTVVEFVSAYDQVIATYYCDKDNAKKTQFPEEGPLRKGYTFTGWSHSKLNIYNEIVNGATYIKVTPSYEQQKNTYQVTINVNGVKDENLSQAVQPGTALTITAPDVTGQKFSHWEKKNENEQNTVLGYHTTYGMIVNDNVEINAVYVDENAVVMKKPAIAMTGIYTTSDNGKNKIAFSATRNIPDDYTLVEHGMIAHKTEFDGADEDFVLGATDVTKFTATTTSKFGVYTLNINMTNNENTPIVARGYLIVKQGNGKEEIYYTDVMRASYVSIAGCIHEYEYVNKGETHSAQCTKDGCGVVKEAEAHTFSYSVEDTTITVSCPICGYEGSVTLNVKDMYCSSISGLATTVNGVEDLNKEIPVSYARKNGETCDGVPTKAGTYIASITLDDATVSKEFTIAHGQDDGEGKCELCGEVVVYVIGANSYLLGEGVSVPNAIIDISAGSVIPGDSVVVTASGMLDYQFMGWYLEEAINNESKELNDEFSAISTSFSTTYTPENNVNLVAVYKEIEKTATVTITGDNFEVYGDNNNTPETYVPGENNKRVYTLTIGEKVTIQVPDDHPSFSEWRNEYGKKITDEREYTFTVTGDMQLVMGEKVVVSENKQALVEFVSDYGQVIDSNIYGMDDGIIIPSGPSKMGYIFKKWSLTEEEIKTKIEQDITYIKVTPVYEWIEVTYSVDVYVNGVKNTKLSKAEVYPGESVIVTAPDIEGKNFLYWTDENDTILGYNVSYGMRINKNVILKAVYGDENEEVEKKPTIVMTNVYTIEESSKKKLAFTVTRDIPQEGYELVEHGVIAMKKAEDTKVVESDFVLGADTGFTKFAATTTEKSGVYTLAVNMTGKEDVPVVARGYLIVKKGDAVEIYYTDMVEHSYNNTKPEK